MKFLHFLKGSSLCLSEQIPAADIKYGPIGNNNALMNLEVGKPFGNMRGFVNLGTWSESEREQAAAYGQLPGDPKWKDIAGATDADGNPIPDGKISTADLTTIGNTSPKFVFGWSNSLSYKNFTLTFLIQGSYGNDIFNATRIKTESPSIGASPNLNNRWTWITRILMCPHLSIS